MLIFKITAPLLRTIRHDLQRPHEHAAERVGFITCKPARLGQDGFIIIATGYMAVRDDHYIESDMMGAVIGADAFRSAMQLALAHHVSIVHVHIHNHTGIPRFSGIDRRETEKFVPTFWNVAPQHPHGAIVLSRDAMYGKCWIPGSQAHSEFDELISTGSPLGIYRRTDHAKLA